MPRARLCPCLWGCSPHQANLCLTPPSQTPEAAHSDPQGTFPFVVSNPCSLFCAVLTQKPYPKKKPEVSKRLLFIKMQCMQPRLKKKKVHKKGSFYFRNRQISGCYCWKPDYSLKKREVMVVIEVKMYFSMKSWLLQQCMSDSLCLSSCYVVNISASNESQTWIQTQLLSLFANNRRVTRATLAV